MNNKIKTAFTLIELLVVIAIIGILSGLIIVGMSSSVQQATIAKAQIFSASLKDSLLMSLVGEWKFDQVGVPAANRTPDSWSINTCTLLGSGGLQNLPQLQTSGCVYGNCLSFDGADDYLDCGNNATLNIAGDITISFWVNSSNLTGEHGIISRGVYGSNNVPYVVSTNGNSLRFTYVRTDGGGSQYSSAFTLAINTYTHIVISHTGVLNGTVTFYKNGIADTPQTTSLQRTSQVTNSTVIGVWKRSVGLGGDVYFNGLLDDVRIYNTVISTSQIKEQYYSGLNRLLARGEMNKKEYLNGIR